MLKLESDLKVSYMCLLEIKILNLQVAIISGSKTWRKEKTTFDSKIGTLEPYAESLPSVLILTAVWVTETKIREDDNIQG